jgi:hypothetical protein
MVPPSSRVACPGVWCRAWGSYATCPVLDPTPPCRLEAEQHLTHMHGCPQAAGAPPSLSPPRPPDFASFVRLSSFSFPPSLPLSLPPSSSRVPTRSQARQGWQHACTRRHTFVVGIVADGERGPLQSKVEQLQLPLRILDPASAARGGRTVRRGGGPARANTRTVHRRQARTHMTRTPDGAVLGFWRLLQRELKLHARNVYVPRHFDTPLTVSQSPGRSSWCHFLLRRAFVTSSPDSRISADGREAC